ncbi:MAG: carboxypeptidase-like regulatory domain-containing protein [Acidimicrobiia bacterium]|nr:carboxypeptidase-like regulatory domain-containing protein [Acidimicrobiia bacterium]MDH3470505.1 carboxypeptidase-like regulatory domain-containing protein [Acidimicrobiia bacterium]
MRSRLPISIALLVILGGAACGGERSSEATAVGDVYPVSGYVHAGPTCPVMQDPPEAGCEDRAVEDAELLVLDASGTETADARTGVDGTFSVTLPPGRYTLVPQPVAGLLGTAEPQDFLVDAGPVVGLDLAYDTGIR